MKKVAAKKPAVNNVEFVSPPSQCSSREEDVPPLIQKRMPYRRTRTAPSGISQCDEVKTLDLDLDLDTHGSGMKRKQQIMLMSEIIVFKLVL